MQHTATYSPEDNKLRLYPAHRLDKDEYERVKAAGFAWAPKQQLFVAGRWTPEREDLLIEMCGEIGDEDTSLVDRAQARAERFEDYADSRKADAEQARAAVARIADGIPFGQPILVGHHSERHARKDAQRIENGMRRAVSMWETSQYWQYRAAGAIAAAKYKELPAVRHRRIKELESELRKQIASFTPHPGIRTMQQPWNAERDAPEVPHVWVGPKGRGGYWVQESRLDAIKARAQRWIEHYQNRIAYERAMLQESGGLMAEKFDIQIGGKVKTGGEWYTVSAVNRGVTGAISSVTAIGYWARNIQIEDIKDYQAPEDGAAEKVKAVKAKPPLCNVRTPGCIEMTTAEWKDRTRCSESYHVVEFDANGKWSGFRKPGVYRQRSAASHRGTGYDRIPVFLTDAKETQPPKAEEQAQAQTERTEVCQELAPQPDPDPPAPRPAPRGVDPQAAEIEAMKKALRAGTPVQVVSVPQLFPTPPHVARKLTEYAGILAGRRVLEPSAGTGRILEAIWNNASGADCVRVVAVEQNYALVEGLRNDRRLRLGANEYNFQIHHADFLECGEGLGVFDAVLMNPPFENGSDIKHIEHAKKLLKPGGRLVAICANGPRQQAKLMQDAEHWEELPRDTFAGTSVSAAIMTWTAPAAEPTPQPAPTAQPSLFGD